MCASIQWLDNRDLFDAPEVVMDDSWTAGVEHARVDSPKTTVNALFSCGDRVALHVTQVGPYAGGFSHNSLENGQEVINRVAGIAVTPRRGSHGGASGERPGGAAAIAHAGRPGNRATSLEVSSTS